jgi:osmotically-inducible protein OsmY
MESGTSLGEDPLFRPSLFDTKDEFIERVAPIGMAAIYFGSFSLAPQDAALSRQALFKLSFIHRHFLQPGGVRIAVQRQTAILSGTVKSRPLVVLAEILAGQIKGIDQVKDETEKGPDSASKSAKLRDADMAREKIHLLFATDQTLRTGVQISTHDGVLTLEGQVGSAAQKNWAEQLAGSAGGEIDSRLKVAASAAGASAENNSLDVDDESLQALVLLRLRLVRETEHLPLRVKAGRGVVSLQGKVRTEALRQRVENLTRSTLGLRELRSTLSIAA